MCWNETKKSEMRVLIERFSDNGREYIAAEIACEFLKLI